MSVGSRGTPRSAKNCRRLGYVSWFITMKPGTIHPHTVTVPDAIHREREIGVNKMQNQKQNERRHSR